MEHTTTNLANGTHPSETAYTVRRATVDDTDGIVKIGRKVFSETFTHNTPENIDLYLSKTYTNEAIRADILNPHRRILVAIPSSSSSPPTPASEAPNGKAEEIAAFAILCTDSTPSEPSVSTWPNPIELQRIYVDTAHHGTGLAKLLSQEVDNLAREERYESIWLGVLPENQRAVRFYEKSGYKKVGTHGFWLGDQLDTDDIMIRML